MNVGAPIVRSAQQVRPSGPSLRLATTAVAIAFVWGLAQAHGPGSALVATTRAASEEGQPGVDEAQALPEALDSDVDGWIDTVERNLGSDPADAASTPESVAIPESCFDAADNDLDGSTDDSDPGCQPPELSTGTFPTAGADSFESTIVLEGYELATGAGICTVDFEGTGPTVVERGDPVGVGGGPRSFDTEIVAMQLKGTGALLAGSPCNPGSTPLSFPATVVEDPAQPSTGKVTAQGPSDSGDFPADSFFDVFFLVDTPLGPLPGGPPGGPAGGPVRVTNIVKSMPPYHSAGNPELNPDCYTVSGLPHEHCPKPPLDHFKCYSGGFPSVAGRMATLADQFGQARTRVGQPDRFCNAVSKDDLRIFDRGAHLERYVIRDPKNGGNQSRPSRVRVRNQFGLQRLSVRDPIGVFVPSQKDREPAPAALDHFKCYSVRGPEVGRTVRLVDQFDDQDGTAGEAVVGKPRTLCNPTAKTVDGSTTPIGDAAWHLVCYAIATHGSTDRSVLVTNQLGKEIVTVDKPVELCVPSLKTIEPPPPRDLSGISRYVHVAGGPHCVRRFEVPSRLKVGDSGLYDRLVFRGNQVNRLLAAYPELFVYLDGSRLYDELTLLFLADGSGRLVGLAATGSERLFPDPNALRRLLGSEQEDLRSSLQDSLKGSTKRLTRLLGLQRPYCLYRVETGITAEKALDVLRDGGVPD